MNAHVSPEERQLLPSTRISYPQHFAEASRRREGLAASLTRQVREYFQRRAVLSELDTLSDRELADIGLMRSSLHSVFTPRR